MEIDARKHWRVIATDDCIKLPDLRLASFDTHEEAEAYRPGNMQELKAQGYKWLEFYPKGWAETHHGFAPYARMTIAS